MEENVLNGSEDKALKIEAQEAVKEIAFAVEHVSICQALPSSDDLVYLNLQTKEGDLMCVELSIQGFRIVARRYDHFDEKDQAQFFETIYSLLDHHSPQYRSSFGDTLMGKLQQLQQQQDTTEQEQ